MNKPKIDLTNKKFGKLTVLEYLGSSTWKCQCDCGNVKNVATRDLNSGHTKSCGCLRKEKKLFKERASKPKKDLTGKSFGYLIPLYYKKGGLWHCRCKCGNELDVDTRNLNSGHTKSCGCLSKEKNSKNYTEDLQENDKRKIEFCKNNNIELRIIKYNENYNLNNLI